MTAVAKKVGTLPAPTSVQGAIDRVLAVASSQVGYHEGRDSDGDWNNDTVFGLWYGLNRNAWCAMFVSWCAAVAGPTTYPKIIPKHAYTPEGFNWFSSRGLADGRKPPNRKGVAATGKGRPRVGDVMYVYSSSLGRISHVGFVEKVLSNGYVQTLEGNTNLSGSAQGDGVYRLKRQVTGRLYFCHPQYAAAVTKPTPAKPPTAKPTTDIPAKEGDNMTDYTPQDIKTYAGQGVHGQRIGRSTVTIGQALDTIRKDTPAIRAALTTLTVQVTGLTAAVKALSEQRDIDPAQILATVKAAADQALDDLKITLVAEPDNES